MRKEIKIYYDQLYTIAGLILIFLSAITFCIALNILFIDPETVNSARKIQLAIGIFILNPLTALLLVSGLKTFYLGLHLKDGTVIYKDDN
jgi:hypothetical protein